MTEQEALEALGVTEPAERTEQSTGVMVVLTDLEVFNQSGVSCSCTFTMFNQVNTEPVLTAVNLGFNTSTEDSDSILSEYLEVYPDAKTNGLSGEDVFSKPNYKWESPKTFDSLSDNMKELYLNYAREAYPISSDFHESNYARRTGDVSIKQSYFYPAGMLIPNDKVAVIIHGGLAVMADYLLGGNK